MDPVRTALVVVLLPGALALLLAAVGRRWAAGGLIGFAVGALASILAQLTISAWPLDVTDRFGHIVFLGALGAFISTRLQEGPRWLLRAGVGVLGGVAVIGPLLEHRLTGLSGYAAIAGFGAAVAVTSRAVRQLSESDDRIGLISLLIAMTVASVAVGISGSVTVAQLGGGVTAALGGVWVVTLKTHRRWLGPLSLAIAVPLVTLLALGTCYSSMNALTALSILAIPIAAAIASHVLSGRRAVVGALGAALALSALAIAPLFASGSATTSDTSDDDYGYE